MAIFIHSLELDFIILKTLLLLCAIQKKKIKQIHAGFCPTDQMMSFV